MIKTSQRMVMAGLFVALFARPIEAQPVDPKADTAEVEALTDKARQLYNEGLEALKKSRWAEAHASFLAAWRIKPHYQIASNLGVAELKLGKHRDAAEHLAFYLREAPKGKEKERQRAQALLAEAQAKVEALTVEVSPEGAEVLVDGVAVGKAPLGLPLFVEVGSHRVEARLDGYTSRGEAVVAEAGRTAGIKLGLEKVQAAAPAPSGSAVPLASNAPSGSGAPPVMLPATGPRTGILVAGGVTAGAALVAGIVFTVLANGKKNDALMLDDTIYQAHGRCVGPGPVDKRCAEFDSITRDGDTFHNVGVGAFVGAGVLAAGTLTYLLWPAPKMKKGSIHLHAAPLIGAGHGELIIKGAF